MSATRCEICNTTVKAGRTRAHERTARHQRTAPLAAEARAAIKHAEAAGLARLTDFDFQDWDKGTPFLASIGVRTERLLTAYGHGHSISWLSPEWWTEAWAAAIANWWGVDVTTRQRALARLAADSSLRVHVPNCSLRLEFQGDLHVTLNAKAYVRDVTAAVDPSLADATMATISLSGIANMWHVHFDNAGSIIRIVPFRATHLAINTPDEVPPLHVMIEAQGAIDEFARCNAAIRWLAGES
jgi:hypothetical protein